jgi:preprotein translocase subunit SecB
MLYLQAYIQINSIHCLFPYAHNIIANSVMIDAQQ